MPPVRLLAVGSGSHFAALESPLSITSWPNGRHDLDRCMSTNLIIVRPHTIDCDHAALVHQHLRLLGGGNDDTVRRMAGGCRLLADAGAAWTSAGCPEGQGRCTRGQCECYPSSSPLLTLAHTHTTVQRAGGGCRLTLFLTLALAQPSPPLALAHLSPRHSRAYSLPPCFRFSRLFSPSTPPPPLPLLSPPVFPLGGAIVQLQASFNFEVIEFVPPGGEF